MDSPQRKPQIRQLTHLLHQYMSRYGYEVIELPIIEAADLFLIKAGDQIVNRLFTFERHGRQFALRPEFTAAAAYRYVQTATSSVVRWQFSGPVFEDDPKDTDRSYQKLSLGAELIGIAGAAAEAEIISMAAHGLSQVGIDHWRINIGHMRLLRQIVARFGLDSRTQRFILHQISVLRDPTKGKSYILEQLDRFSDNSSLLGKETSNFALNASPRHLFDALLTTAGNNETPGGRTQQDIARRLLQKRQRAADRGQIIKALDALIRWCEIELPPHQAFQVMDGLADDSLIHQTLTDWKTIIELLEAYQISSEQITIRPGLARSWEYYTGTVFDLATTEGTPVGGGGRYDELTRLIGGEREIPAVGFAYYLDQMPTTLLAMNNQLLQFSLAVTPTNAAAAAQWAHQLRQKGFTVQLVPSEYMHIGLASLVIDDRGYAVQNNKVYTLADIDALIYELERAAP